MLKSSRIANHKTQQTATTCNTAITLHPSLDKSAVYRRTSCHSVSFSVTHLNRLLYDTHRCFTVHLLLKAILLLHPWHHVLFR